MNNSSRNYKNIINPTRFICNHLIGKEHKLVHRIVVGSILMVLGVCLTKVALLSPSTTVHILGDTVGFLFHGIGIVPYVELVVNMNQNINDEEYKSKD